MMSNLAPQGHGKMSASLPVKGGREGMGSLHKDSVTLLIVVLVGGEQT